MTNEKPNYSKLFWASCRKCKHKFGIDPKYVMLYVERIMRERGDTDVMAGLEEAQAEVEQKDAPKKEHCPHCLK